MSWEKWDAEHRSAGVRETKASDFSTKVTSGGKHLGNINRQGGKHLAVTKVNGSLRAHEFTTHQGALNHIRKTHGLPTVSTKKTSYAIPPPPPGMRLPTARKTANAPTAAKKVAAPSHAFADWNAEHGHGAGGTSSADKIAASIRGALGASTTPAPKVASAKGKSGSVISRAEGAKSTAAHVLKKDMKRPAPVKGEKDAADAFKTKIRMAAYNEKKKAALKGDPVDKATPHTEVTLNPHASTASKIAASIGVPVGQNHSIAQPTKKEEYRKARDAAHEAGMKSLSQSTITNHKAAAAAHLKAASLAPSPAVAQGHTTNAKLHQDKVNQLSKPSAPAKKVTALPTAPAAPKAATAYSAAAAAADKASKKAYSSPTIGNHRAAALSHAKARSAASSAGRPSAAARHDQAAKNHKHEADKLQSGSNTPAEAKKYAAEAQADAARVQKANALHTVPEPKQRKFTEGSAEDLADKAEKATRLANDSPSYVNHQKAYEAHVAASDKISDSDMGYKGRQYHMMMQGYHRFAADHPSKVIPAGVKEEHKDKLADRMPKVDTHQSFTGFTDTTSRRHAQQLYNTVSKASESRLTPGQKSSVAAYTGSTYKSVNNHLRYNGQRTPAMEKKSVEDHISNLDAAINKQPALAHDLITYRGGGDVSDLFGKVGEKVGGEFVDHGYTSTSSHAAVGQNFGRETVMRILHPAGSKVIKPSSVGAFGDAEREILTPRGTRFHIAADRLVTLQNGSTQRQIDLIRK